MFKIENPKYRPESERWEIDVPKGELNFYLSTTLAVLLPIAENDEEFEAKFCLLTTDFNEEELQRAKGILGDNVFTSGFKVINEINEQELSKTKELIKHFNPFLNKYFRDGKRELIKLLRDSRRIIYHFMCLRSHTEYNRDFDIAFTDDYDIIPAVTDGEQIIDYICHMLKCKIELFSSGGDDKDLFPRDNRRNCEDYSDYSPLLTLYRETCSSDDIQPFHFRFGLDKDVGSRLRESAIRTLLHNAGIDKKKTEEILHQLDRKDNLLASLLINKNLTTVKTLYRQRYIISKLFEAGYKTDPRDKDSDDDDKTGFFYAMKNGDYETIRVLYEYIGHSFESWDDGSPRISDKSNSKDLEMTKLALEEALGKIEKLQEVECEEKQKKITIARGLINYSNYEAAICREFLAKCLECASATDDITRTDIVKEFIKNILSTYEHHSKMNQETTLANSEGAGSYSLLDKRYSTYMEDIQFSRYLDKGTALYFFDFIFLLKQSFKIKVGTYEKVESSLLYFAICVSFYTSRLSSKCEEITQKLNDRKIYPLIKKFYSIITFLERLELEQRLKSFKDLLESTPVTLDNTIHCLPSDETETLTSHPEIRNTFVLKRMMRYLELATEVDLENDWKVGMLVIERALQVLGESLLMISDSESSITIFDCILLSSFSFKMQCMIKRIRNILSHLEQEKLFFRLEVEKERELFSRIKEDLKNIKEKFINFLHFQRLQEEKYVFKNGFDILCEQKKVLETLRAADDKEYMETELSLSTLLENSPPETLHLDNCEEISESRKLMSSKLHTLGQRKEENRRQYEDIEKLGEVFKDIERDIRLEIAEVVSKNLAIEWKNNIDLLIDHMCEHLTSYVKKKETKELATDKTNQTNKQKQKKFKRQNKPDQQAERKESQEIKQPNRTSGNPRVADNPNDIAGLMTYYLKAIHIVLQTIIEESGCSKNLIENFPLTFVFGNDEKIFIKELNEKPENKFPEIKKFYKTIMKEIKGSEKSDPENYTDFPGISELINLHKNPCCLTDEEKNILLSHASRESKQKNETKKSLIEIFENRTVLSSESVEQKICTLSLSNKDQKFLIENYNDEAERKCNLEIIQKVKDDFGKLEIALAQNKKLNTKDYERICIALNFKDEDKVLLTKIVNDQSFKVDRDLEFLMDRITLLEELLIKPYPDIQDILIASKGEKAREQVKRKILPHFIQNRKLQAAVEMLLFDCMNLFKKKEKFENLLYKSSKTFAGINLRHVLGHGNPLLETVSEMLDPIDLPSDIVTSTIKFITHRESLEKHLKKRRSQPKKTKHKQSYTSGVEGTSKGDQKSGKYDDEPEFRFYSSDELFQMTEDKNDWSRYEYSLVGWEFDGEELYQNIKDHDKWVKYDTKYESESEGIDPMVNDLIECLDYDYLLAECDSDSEGTDPINNNYNQELSDDDYQLTDFESDKEFGNIT